MLVRHLTVGGLRTYGTDPLEVELAPLTLLFGQNSAGKSTLCSVLPILQETSQHPETLSLTGSLVGGSAFRSAIHNHDLSTPMTLGLGWSGTDNQERSAIAEFRWDPATAKAKRSQLTLAADSDARTMSGPRAEMSAADNEWIAEFTLSFREVMDRSFHLGPMRARPNRTTSLSGIGDDYVGPAGENMAELLATRPALLDRVNHWCDVLELGYRVSVLTPTSDDILATAGDFAVVALQDTRVDPPLLVSPTAVGYGIGQLLPVITQCSIDAGGLVIIEQPEVHLHPKLQAAVGDLLVDTVNEGRNQLLLETHSEHLILRLLRRVREGVLNVDDLAILYVDLHEDGAAFIQPLELDRSGELIDGWPGGFFEERLSEVLPGLGVDQ